MGNTLVIQQLQELNGNVSEFSGSIHRLRFRTWTWFGYVGEKDAEYEEARGRCVPLMLVTCNLDSFQMEAINRTLGEIVKAVNALTRVVEENRELMGVRRPAPVPLSNIQVGDGSAIAGGKLEEWV